MQRDLARLPELLDQLEAFHGAPSKAPPERALDWVLWENAGYLVPDAKRESAYRELEAKTGLSAKGILALPHEELRALAALGGMLVDGRVAKLLKIAELVQASFAGDLEAQLALPISKARAALKRFPGIGAPGADKILLFTGTHALPALESNGLRVLVRLGFAREAKSYATTYRAAIAALQPHVERGCAWLERAHLLLRRHGQELCKNNGPLCDGCPLASDCPAA